MTWDIMTKHSGTVLQLSRYTTKKGFMHQYRPLQGNVVQREFQAGTEGGKVLLAHFFYSSTLLTKQKREGLGSKFDHRTHSLLGDF